jgi:GNAT superfamily N-acetyltransferase
MVNRMAFEKIGALAEIDQLRNQYLDNLLEAQELYLEMMIRNSEIFAINSDNQRIGYYLLGEGKTLLEFYVDKEHGARTDSILGLIIKKHSLRKAFCKSFDHGLLSACIGFQKKVRPAGILFREFEEKAANPNTKVLGVRLAEAKDERQIIGINEAVFEKDDEVRDYIDQKQIFLFGDEATPCGFGIFARTIAGRPEFDIGMVVDRKYRRRGYGEFIVRYLVDYCKRNGWRAIGGCDIKNEGSRRCLEKAGFIGRYRLLEFEF